MVRRHAADQARKSGAWGLLGGTATALVGLLALSAGAAAQAPDAALAALRAFREGAIKTKADARAATLPLAALMAGSTADGAASSAGVQALYQEYCKAYAEARARVWRRDCSALDTFVASLALLVQTNMDGTAAHWSSLNQFSDMTFNEFQTMMLPPLELPSGVGAQRTPDDAGSGVQQPPWPQGIQARKNWAEEGHASPVKDQGGCGAGSAFAATAAIESAMSIAGLSPAASTDLSEQQLVACMHQDLGRPEHDWCERGAWGSTLLAYLNGTGDRLTTEALWRYSAWYHRACDPARRPTATWPADGASVHDYRAGVGRGSRDEVLRAMQQQPVMVYAHMGPALQHYGGGVISGASACPQDSSGSVNHAMLLVGWDAAARAWIAKNSWGATWGMGGYLHVEMVGGPAGACSMYTAGVDFPIITPGPVPSTPGPSLTEAAGRVPVGLVFIQTKPDFGEVERCCTVWNTDPRSNFGPIKVLIYEYCSAYHPVQLFSLERVGGTKWFKIVPSPYDPSLCLAVEGASQGVSVRTEFRTCFPGADHQLFSITHQGSGWFRIQPKHSSKCLAVAILSFGPYVLQDECQPIDSQLFRFKTGGAWLFIANPIYPEAAGRRQWLGQGRHSTLPVWNDVSIGASVLPGCVLTVFEHRDFQGQRAVLSSDNYGTRGELLSEDLTQLSFKISSAVVEREQDHPPLVASVFLPTKSSADMGCLDVSSPSGGGHSRVQQHACDGRPAQLFNLEREGVSSWYRVVPASDPSQCLEVPAASQANSSDLALGGCALGDHQLFAIQYQGSGWFRMRPKRLFDSRPYQCVRVQDDRADDLASIQQGECGRSGSQLFKISVEAFWTRLQGAGPGFPLDDLERHSVQCFPGTGLTGWQLSVAYNRHGHGSHAQQLLFNFTRPTTPLGAGVLASTPAGPDGGGQVAYLDRHNVTCGPGSVLTAWHLHRPSPGQIAVRYLCASLSLTSCQAKATPWGEWGDELGTNYLDRHPVQCPASHMLSGWRLEADPAAAAIRIAYTCCA